MFGPRYAIIRWYVRNMQMMAEFYKLHDFQNHLYISHVSPDDCVSGPKYVMSGIIQTFVCVKVNPSSFICKHHKQDTFIWLCGNKKNACSLIGLIYDLYTSVERWCAKVYLHGSCNKWQIFKQEFK
jgi:hypothetical protein